MNVKIGMIIKKLRTEKNVTQARYDCIRDDQRFRKIIESLNKYAR